MKLISVYELKNEKLACQKQWQLNLNQISLRVTSTPSQAPLSPEDHEKNAKESSQAQHPQKDLEKHAKECAHALQSLKSNGEQSNQGTQVNVVKGKPEWIERFIARTFFDNCSDHPIRRNELNKYCIDCDAPLCQYCMPLSFHTGHRLLKIYRHVYKDVVLIEEIKRHLDCSQIQPYRCNKQMVVALTPLPHTGSKTNEEEGTCHTCKRKLMEYESYIYCSISCKVEAFTKKRNDSVPPFLAIAKPVPRERGTKTSIQITEASTNNNDGAVPTPTPIPTPTPTPTEQSGQKAKEETKTSFRTRKRKGTPHRAPFF